VARGGFKALRRVQSGMTPAQVIEEVKRSGCGVGRGRLPDRAEMGADSPIAEREEVHRLQRVGGEVGAFKDRYILEGNPFALIEGIAIAAYAVGQGRRTYTCARSTLIWQV